MCQGAWRFRYLGEYLSEHRSKFRIKQTRSQSHLAPCVFLALEKMSKTQVHIPDSQTYPLESFNIQDHYKDDLSSILIPHGMIRDRTEKLAWEISQTLTKPVLACCVLKAFLI